MLLSVVVVIFAVMVVSWSTIVFIGFNTMIVDGFVTLNVVFAVDCPYSTVLATTVYMPIFAGVYAYSYIPSSLVVTVYSSPLINSNTSASDTGDSSDLTVPVIVVVSPIPQSVALTVILALYVSTSKYDPT